MSRLIIFAPNVGVGGGLVLLRALLGSLAGQDDVIALLDERGKSAISGDGSNVPTQWFRSSVSGRWRAERALASIARDQDRILCFHSLPPVLARHGTLVCHVHSPNLVGMVDKGSLSSWVRLRSAVEKAIFHAFVNRIDRFIVQTPTMAEALRGVLGSAAQTISVLPFLAPGALPRPDAAAATSALQEFDFLYVSDGAAHKNHRRLFDAWELLAAKGVFPSLALTLHPQRDAGLLRTLDTAQRRSKVRIVDLGQMPHRQLLAQYGRTRALMFASFAETFGLPLIEAQAAGIPIIAAERDFVRDVCTPAITFDPFSARSMANAVLRFLGEDEPPMTPLTPERFVQAVRDQPGHGKS